MNITVGGCGKIGSTILANLVSEGHDVTAIDNDPDVITEITNIHDVIGVCGNGADCATLEESNVADSELFVAVTGSDEFNMLSCFLAKKMGAKHTIARIRNPEYNSKSLSFLRHQLDLAMSINPEMLAAQELFNILRLPSAVKIETFSRRNFEIIEMNIKENSPLSNVRLIDLRDRFHAKFLICAVQRNDRVYIPDGNFELKAGDKIGLTASPTEIHKLMKGIGFTRKQSKSIMIMGGSKIAFYLSKMLLSSGSSVKIIEKDAEKCKKICEAFPKAMVINGDGAEYELLLEEGINSTDAFVALTGMDEENILISIFASIHNVPKVISKVNRDELANMAAKLGLDCIISPKKIISDVLVQYARALQNSLGSKIETLYKLMDGNVEALEFTVKSDSRLIQIPIKELKFKPNILIAGILRNRNPIIPDGDDVIMSGDRVVVITTNKGYRIYRIL